MKSYDVIIIGGGAAGLMAARSALMRGKRVAVIDMGDRPGRKILASGGGRCNITNAAAAYDKYFGKNPMFVRGALARVSPRDILDWMARHKLRWTEKAAGQYFCATGAADVVAALINDTKEAEFFKNTTVCDMQKTSDGFIVSGQGPRFYAKSVIVATGGISFPTLGVSDAGYKIAKKFGHRIIPARPALCGIATNIFPTELAGISMPVEITIGREKITDSVLFTHFGIGGPAGYRTTVRDINSDIHINLMPANNIGDILRTLRQTAGRKTLSGGLSEYVPARVAKWIAAGDGRNIADIPNTDIDKISARIHNIIIPADAIKFHNLQSAEVVRGGVDTADISSKTMESKICPGLFFAGEVMDIAGDLGGFNLHWAWASGTVAGMNA